MSFPTDSGVRVDIRKLIFGGLTVSTSVESFIDESASLDSGSF